LTGGPSRLRVELITVPEAGIVHVVETFPLLLILMVILYFRHHGSEPSVV
jgi:hypothetical protein